MEAQVLLRRDGFGYLRSRMTPWCRMAKHYAVVILTDLDRAACPSTLLDEWFGVLVRPPNLLLRVAVRELESWLLADHQAMRALIGNSGVLPVQPDRLVDSKQHLLGLARHARREVRLDLVKEIGVVARQGIGYNARLGDLVRHKWSPARAAQRSPSLARARLRLSELAHRLHQS